ncbi:uncharacterized protein BDZ99DRAFT_453601 [Mytilinidion resinicola]|uniref:DUF6594 domain-containing protein n=1 Tax=Mytilinidion resinicola TaxID=574789 RepID=A0A6A6Y6A0_9PEZI|nr:uncharacterized protein BDZ99DRAFT_453601 [Mytilinidion resinicola]KAF2803327.1 hypothetical protein BDZ99DRAFT_453601 [Mytilinidion resinicola]
MNIELGRLSSRDCDGYRAVAAWIARDPDNETFIYRRFDQLSARNLLYLQSKLLALEQRLAKLDTHVASMGDLDLKDSARRWEAFAKNAKSRDEEGEMMELVIQIRGRIKEYHEALLLQSQVAKLERPSNRVIEAFRIWFDGGKPKQGNPKPDPVLGGRAKYVLDNEQDLVALKTPADDDFLSRFLQDHWPVTSRQNSADRTGHYQERHVIWAVAVISTFIASVLLVGAIASLYAVQSSKGRLGMIGAFTALFALSVILLTNARRAEVFAATAAYAAVLVVFVSGNLGSSNSNKPP